MFGHRAGGGFVGSCSPQSIRGRSTAAQVEDQSGTADNVNSSFAYMTVFCVHIVIQALNS